MTKQKISSVEELWEDVLEEEERRLWYGQKRKEIEKQMYLKKMALIRDISIVGLVIVFWMVHYLFAKVN